MYWANPAVSLTGGINTLDKVKLLPLFWNLNGTVGACR